MVSLFDLHMCRITQKQLEAYNPRDTYEWYMNTNSRLPAWFLSFELERDGVSIRFHSENDRVVIECVGIDVKLPATPYGVFIDGECSGFVRYMTDRFPSNAHLVSAFFALVVQTWHYGSLRNGNAIQGVCAYEWYSIVLFAGFKPKFSHIEIKMSYHHYAYHLTYYGFLFDLPGEDSRLFVQHEWHKSKSPILVEFSEVLSMFWKSYVLQLR